MKTPLLFFVACCAALPVAAQPAPPEFATPPPPTSHPPAVQEALRRSLAGGTNVVVRPSAPVAGVPAPAAARAVPTLPSAPPAVRARPPAVDPAAPAPAATPTAPPVAGPALPGPVGAPAAVPPPTAPPPAGVTMLTNAPPAQPAEEIIPAGLFDWVGSGGADLEQVFDYYARISGRTVLRPSNLPAAPIKLKTQTDLTRREMIQALDSVLALNAIAMIPVGDKFVKAVPKTQAGQEGAPLQRLDSGAYAESGAFVTHILQTKYFKPTELEPLLTQFASVGMTRPVVAIDSSQTIILRDTTENVKRMLELIEEVDKPIPSEFVSEVIPIKYAMAADIASALSSLSSGGAVTSSGGTTGAGGRTGTTGRPGSSGTSRLGMSGGFQQPGQPGVNPLGAAGQPGQPGAQASFSDRLQQIIKRASTTSTGDILVVGPTKIVADERANSLLVFASRADMSIITNIVAKLDVVLPQVLIESIIMDVSLSDNLEFGVSGIQTPRQFGGDFSGAGGANANTFFNFTGSSATNAMGDLLGSGLKYFGKFNDDVYVTVKAMADQGRVTVIQKPRIMTFHAKPASFFIGSTVPYVTSTSYYGGYGGYGGPSSQYQQLKVGIGLYVTPYINQDGLVVMEIEQQMEEIDGYTKIENVGEVPNTASKTLSAQLAVKDRETIILGGFIRTLRSKSDSGVPVLKDIPFFGALFKQINSSNQRKELVVLIRPTVMKTPELAAEETLADKLRLPGVTLAEGEDAIMEAEQIKQVNKHLEGEEKKVKKSKLLPK